ncbi:MAG: histidinol-phosphate transaminase [Bacteroidales bacterium]
MKPLKDLVRKGLWELSPYSTARDEFKGDASIYLDANELPYNTEWNRYPDPYQLKLREAFANYRNIDSENVFAAHGSDEVIDLLIRIFCESHTENIVGITPSYGMYKVCAEQNLVEYREALLNPAFGLNSHRINDAIDGETKLIFLCSPNNPNGNSFELSKVKAIADSFDGIVVLDEAYIDFSENKSGLSVLKKTPNLIVLQTMSKAWGLASLRIGFAFGSKEIIRLLDKQKLPYNISKAVADIAISHIQKPQLKENYVRKLIKERESLINKLNQCNDVLRIFHSDANFLLVKFKDSKEVFEKLKNQGIILRDRSKLPLCKNCLRISIGTSEENRKLISVLSL